MKRTSFQRLAVLLLIVGLASAGCDSSPNDMNEETVFVQQDRLARPAVNEVLATWADDRHEINNSNQPTQDAGDLQTDVVQFMTNAAGRSQAHADVLASILVPDVMVADLSKDGPAAYLGVETGGATGSLFGGRKPADDVVDISLGAIFGTTLSDLDLVEPDDNEIPSLTSDNVGVKYSTSDAFPYLRPPVTP